MVATRSQSNRNTRIETENMSDNESDHSLADMLSRDQMTEFDSGDLLISKRNYDRNRIEQKFSDMNRQIGELINIVQGLTEKVSSNNREGNGLDVLSNEPNTRYFSLTKLELFFKIFTYTCMSLPNIFDEVIAKNSTNHELTRS